jgi:hypothetical protein
MSPSGSGTDDHPSEAEDSPTTDQIQLPGKRKLMEEMSLGANLTAKRQKVG